MSTNTTTITAEPGAFDLTITREFEAPRELLFRAYTEEKIYAQWLGPNGLETRFETFEPFNGGKYRFLQTDKDGNTYSFRGVMHDVLPNERIIGTFEFEGLPETGHVALTTTRFEALPDNRSRVTSQSVFQSVADRDGMIQSGMEHGVVEGNQRLDALLEQMKNKTL